MDNQLINQMLNEISNGDYSMSYKNNTEYIANPIQFKNTLRIMLRDICVISEGVRESTYIINDKGRRIIEEGGWLKHLQNEKVKSEKAENKTKLEFRLAKWQYYSFWPIFIFGLFGGLYSLNEILKNSNTKQSSEFNQTDNQSVMKNIDTLVKENDQTKIKQKLKN